MFRYWYEISHEPNDAAHPWALTLDGRRLARFAALESALASAKSLHDIDQRTGARPTVDVIVSSGRFRVTWVEGADDAVRLDSIAGFSIPGVEPGRGANAQRPGPQ